MKHLIVFDLEDGHSLTVEVDEPEDEYGGGVLGVDMPGQVLAKARQSFEQSLETIKPAAVAIVKKLRSLAESPDEIQVEFGIKLNAEAGAVVASSGVEANFTITLKWVK